LRDAGCEEAAGPVFGGATLPWWDRRTG